MYQFPQKWAGGPSGRKQQRLGLIRLERAFVSKPNYNSRLFGHEADDPPRRIASPVNDLIEEHRK
jgi:hypothetical protein